jgi:hypothetical protein
MVIGLSTAAGGSTGGWHAPAKLTVTACLHAFVYPIETMVNAGGGGALIPTCAVVVGMEAEKNAASANRGTSLLSMKRAPVVIASGRRDCLRETGMPPGDRNASSYH